MTAGRDGNRGGCLAVRWQVEQAVPVIGPVCEPSDIYADAWADDAWQDPDASADPTENPPRAGFVVVLNRYREVSGSSLSEELVVHSSGIMSYLQLHPSTELPPRTATVRRDTADHEIELGEGTIDQSGALEQRS